uniref:Uncharacterized protein n=1 Tax=Anguilla anguilla TaxID=7936 RepID=A0A0E9Y0W7_ANGAN
MRVAKVMRLVTLHYIIGI